jgi:hypothetical protein
MKTLVALIIALGTVSVGAAAEPATCHGNTVRLSGLKGLPVEFSNPNFFSKEDRSYADLKAISRSSMLIRFYLVMVEYADSTGKHVLTMPFVNNDMKGRLPSWLPHEWLDNYGVESNTGFSQGEERTLIASGPFIIPNCPDTASIEYVFLILSDGSTLEFGSKPILDPLLLHAQLTSRAKTLPAATRGSFLLSEDGFIKDLELPDVSDQALKAKVISELAKGRFFRDPNSSSEVAFVLLNKSLKGSQVAKDEWFQGHAPLLILVFEPFHNTSTSGWTVHPSTAKTGIGAPRLRVASEN